MVRDFTFELFGTLFPAIVYRPSNVIPEQTVVPIEECVRRKGDLSKE